MDGLPDKLRALVEDPGVFEAVSFLIGGERSHNRDADRRAASLLLRVMEPQHLEEFLTHGYVSFGELELHADGDLVHKKKKLSCIRVDAQNWFPRLDIVVAYYLYLKEDPQRIEDIVLRHERVIGNGVHYEPDPAVELDWIQVVDKPYIFVSSGVRARISGVPDYGQKAILTWCAIMHMSLEGEVADPGVVVLRGNGSYELPDLWILNAPRLVAYRLSEVVGCSLEDATLVMCNMEDPDGTINNPEFQALLDRVNSALQATDRETRLKNLPQIMAGFAFRDIVDFYRRHPEEAAEKPQPRTFISSTCGCAAGTTMFHINDLSNVNTIPIPEGLDFRIRGNQAT